MICCALRHRAQSITEHYNHLLLYSIYSWPTLHWTLIVNLIYWFAQSVPTLSGSTTQPSHIPQVLHLAKPRPDLGLHPCGAVHNNIVVSKGVWESPLWVETMRFRKHLFIEAEEIKRWRYQSLRLTVSARRSTTPKAVVQRSSLREEQNALHIDIRLY